MTTSEQSRWAGFIGSFLALVSFDLWVWLWSIPASYPAQGFAWWAVLTTEVGFAVWIGRAYERWWVSRKKSKNEA